MKAIRLILTGHGKALSHLAPVYFLFLFCKKLNVSMTGSYSNDTCDHRWICIQQYCASSQGVNKPELSLGINQYNYCNLVLLFAKTKKPLTVES